MLTDALHTLAGWGVILSEELLNEYYTLYSFECIFLTESKYGNKSLNFKMFKKSSNMLT